MAGTTTEVRVGVDGIVSTGAFGATAPTSASSALGAGWTDQGYVSEDGVTETTAVTSEVIRAWQKAKIVRTTITEGVVSWAFTLIQTNKAIVELFHGSEVAADGSIVLDPTLERPTIAIVLDVIDGTELIRTYAPEAHVSEVGDLVYSNGAPIGYELTIEALHNETLGGAAQKWYSSLAAAVVPTITSALPSAAAQGAQVKIVGSAFTGVTGSTSVKFGSTNATSYMVDDDATIYAVMPAGTAGAANIVVTNATGASAAFSYTRGS